MPRRNPNSGTDVNTRTRRIEALELRKLGYSYQRIADRLSYADRSGAYLAVQRELERTAAPVREEVRQIEALKLDDMEVAWALRSLKGDLTATQIRLRIMARRATLLGLDQAVADAIMTGPIIIEVPSATALGILGSTQTTASLSAYMPEDQTAEESTDVVSRNGYSES